MKKLLLLLSLCISMLALNASAQESLADAARKARANRHANPSTQVIDNDMVPSALPSSVTPKNAEKAKSADLQDKDKAGQPKKDETEPGKEGEAKVPEKTANAKMDKQKKIDDLKKQIDDQKKEITQLQRELDVVEREARLRAAAYYADAGTMLRDQGKFLEDSRQEQADIASKKQAIADGKLKLDDLLEDARKAGIRQE